MKAAFGLRAAGAAFFTAGFAAALLTAPDFSVEPTAFFAAGLAAGFLAGAAGVFLAVAIFEPP
jgi:hypothetical protein